MAALCDNYDADDGVRWKLSADISGTTGAIEYLKKLGMDSKEVDSLYQLINKQHNEAGTKWDKDFAHELVNMRFLQMILPHIL